MNKQKWPGCLRNPAQRELMRKMAFLLRRDKPVTIPDLEWELKRLNSTLHAQTLRLAEEGYIVILGQPNDRKTLEFTDEGRAWVRVMSARVLGEVPAGEGLEGLEAAGCEREGHADYVETYDRLLPPTEDFGVYTVRGDSMIGDGILPGDRIHLELGVRLGELELGEKAVVMVGENSRRTFKHVHYDRDNCTVTLRASNPAYPDDVAPSSDVRVVGAYYGMIRVEDKPNRKERK